MAVGSVTIHNILRHPYVVKVISRVAPAGTPLTNHYRLGMSSSGMISVPVGSRGFTYDIFDHTKTMASLRAPEAGPKRIRRQRVGIGSGHLLRAYEALNVTYEQIANLRPLGSPIGTLDKQGQSYVTRQIAYGTERFRNLREWSLSRMFRGGFGITIEGDDHYVVESGSGQIAVDFQHPAANRSQLAVGDGGADIIDTPWSSSSSDIITQLLNLNKAAERRTGLPIEDIWINSTTLGWLINNTVLQAAGGAAFRVWESVTWKDMSTVDGNSRRRGMDVVFRAIPWITFKVYDGVLHNGAAQVDVIPAASTDVDLVIPNGVALMTPAPSPEWLSFAEGTEIIHRTIGSSPEEVKGFTSWSRPTMDPYGKELLMVDNFFPVPFIPAAWYYATIDF